MHFREIGLNIASGNTSDAMMLAGGAAVVGCAAHMVGFAIASFRENKFGGLIAQGIGTSMLQIPNIMRKPKIMLPAIISSAVVGPLSTCLFCYYSLTIYEHGELSNFGVGSNLMFSVILIRC